MSLLLDEPGVVLRRCSVNVLMPLVSKSRRFTKEEPPETGVLAVTSGASGDLAGEELRCAAGVAGALADAFAAERLLSELPLRKATSEESGRGASVSNMEVSACAASLLMPPSEARLVDPDVGGRLTSRGVGVSLFDTCGVGDPLPPRTS